MKIKLVYSVPENCKASGDLMMPNGRFIRNLFNHKQLYSGRTYTEYYDDVDNLSIGTYKLRLTTNNIKTYWEIIIGNTSAKMSGPTMFYNMEQAKDMDAGNNHYFYATGYNEGKTSCMRIPRGNLKVSEQIFPDRGMSATAVCVKNGIVYWAGVDPSKTLTYGDEFNSRFMHEGKTLKEACEGFPDYAEGRVRKCVHIYIDDNDKFAGYRNAGYSDTDFVKWFNQYVFNAIWGKSFSGVWATNEIDNTEQSFTFGREYKVYAARTYKSMIGIYEGESADVTGLAVSDDFIYVAYGGQANIWYWNSRDIISVLDLNGREVNRYQVSKPGKMIVVDDYLFYASGNKVCKANIDKIGGIETIEEFVVNGSFTIMDISYYKTTDTLAVIATDGIIHYYDKQFNLKKECGNKEMYWEKPQVYNDKFYWEDTRQTYETFICTDILNGTQLIGDSGNNRIQVFDRNFAYKTTISWLNTSYQVGAIDAEPHRIFCEYLEFNRDYTNPKSLKWKLVNNWGCYATTEYIYLDMPFTLNGKTYARQQGFTGVNIRLVELNPKSGLVMLNVVSIPSSSTRAKALIYPDGSIYCDESKVGNYIRVSKRAFLGVNEDGTFNWAAPLVIVNIPNLPEGTTLNNQSKRVYETIDNTFYVYNAHRQEMGNHLSAIDIPTNTFINNGFPSTHENYFGDYIDDMFDNGNGVVYAGGIYIAKDKFIICNYHGEFWGGGQVNKWHLFDENLVALHTYGTDIKTIRKQGIEWPSPKMAGNSFNGNLVKYGNYFYLYHCDEGHHGGIHSVRFEGMDTVKRTEFEATVLELNENPTLVYPLSLLPRCGDVRNNEVGWKMQPEEAYEISNEYFRIKAGRKYLSRVEPSDLTVSFRGLKKVISVWYDIEPVTASRWSLSGMINYEDNWHSRDNGINTANKFQLIDDNNNVLFELWPSIHYASKQITLHANDKIVFTLPEVDAEKILDYFRTFSIYCVSNILSFKYHTYPAITIGTLETKPAKISITMFNMGSSVLPNSVSLIRLKFNKR